MLNPKLLKQLLAAQRNEITEYYIYSKLAQTTKRVTNHDVLDKIAKDEMDHYNAWKVYTTQDVTPNKFKVWKYIFISNLFGVTFGVKLMERGEKLAQTNYKNIVEQLPEARRILEDEHRHERDLINSIEEEGLKYVGSIVLGLNDALVELTGALAGFTLALQNTRLIAMTGLITGIAASLSMAVSEYLSTKTEATGKHPIKAAVYTGIAYIGTVFLLIIPYLVAKNLYVALGWTIGHAILIILCFTFYISIARDLSFKRRFFEMAAMSLGIAIITFGVGYLVRIFFGVEI